MTNHHLVLSRNIVHKCRKQWPIPTFELDQEYFYSTILIIFQIECVLFIVPQRPKLSTEWCTCNAKIKRELIFKTRRLSNRGNLYFPPFDRQQPSLLKFFQSWKVRSQKAKIVLSKIDPRRFDFLTCIYFM